MSQWFNQIEWYSPYMLILLGIIPFLLYREVKQASKHSASLIYPSFDAFKPQLSWKLKLYQSVPYLKYLALVFLIIALARPQWVLREEKIDAEGIDIFLVMDLSSSMLSQDFNPNRLEISKLVAIDFVKKRSYDRIGLVGFSGEGFTQCPLTVDHQILTNLLSQLECGYLNDGTAIGLGLSTAINRLKDDSLTHSKVIILLTDGVNNAGEISPDLAAEMAKVFNIKIYAIGVGSTGEAYSPVGRQANGEFVFGMAPVNIDENLLRKITSETGGIYYRATNQNELQQIYQEIDRLEKTKIEVKVFKRFSEEYRFFLLIGLFLLVLAWIIRITFNRLMP